MNQGGADDLDAVFAALANPYRRRIVELLALQPASIQQLARQLGLSLTAINRHIHVLEDAALVRRKKSGRVNFLAIRRGSLQLLQHWAQPFHSYWGSDEDSLDNYVDSISRADRPNASQPPKEHKG